MPFFVTIDVRLNGRFRTTGTNPPLVRKSHAYTPENGFSKDRPLKTPWATAPRIVGREPESENPERTFDAVPCHARASLVSESRSVTNSLSWGVLALPLRGLLTLIHNPRVSGVVLFLIPTKRPDRLVVSPRRVSPGEEPRSRWRNGDRQSLEDEPEGRSPPGRTNVRRLEW